MAVDHEALVAMLTRLKLTAIRDQLDSLLDEAARADMSLREALAFLCGREVARKDERRIEMALKIAHFPCARELDGFDFAAQPSLARPCQATERWAATRRLADRLCGGHGDFQAPFTRPKIIDLAAQDHFVDTGAIDESGEVALHRLLRADRRRAEHIRQHGLRSGRKALKIA